jgi:hypothetical protein
MHEGKGLQQQVRVCGCAGAPGAIGRVRVVAATARLRRRRRLRRRARAASGAGVGGSAFAASAAVASAVEGTKLALVLARHFARRLLTRLLIEERRHGAGAGALRRRQQGRHGYRVKAEQRLRIGVELNLL